MIMADVFAVFGTLLAVAIALPALLLTWQLLHPNLTTRAEMRVGQTPWLCFFAGIGFLVLAAIPLIILFNLPWSGFQVMGFIGIFVLMALASLGAAGMAALLGKRMQGLGLSASAVGATLRGAIAMELAAAFPIIGWFIFIPITFTVVFGAALFALVGWVPKPKARPASVQTPTQEIVASA